MYRLLPLVAVVLSAHLDEFRESCLPPTQVACSTARCSDPHPYDPQYSCSGALFVRSMGEAVRCRTHSDCYNYREPNDWCHLPPQYSWAGKGCFCDEKLGRCIMERQGAGVQEWTYCTAARYFRCNEPGYGICAVEDVYKYNKV